MELRERFERKIERIPWSGCWVWMGGDFTYGYGAFSYKNQNRPAHRIAWILYKGEIPSGLQVLHRCDIPFCVNPEHLFLGTHDDNMADKMRKGRQARGERHGMSKLSDADVKAIGVLKNIVGLKAKEIAPLFDITPERIWQLFPAV